MGGTRSVQQEEPVAERVPDGRLAERFPSRSAKKKKMRRPLPGPPLANLSPPRTRCHTRSAAALPLTHSSLLPTHTVGCFIISSGRRVSVRSYLLLITTRAKTLLKFLMNFKGPSKMAAGLLSYLVTQYKCDILFVSH